MVPKCEFCHAYASLIINSSEYIRFIKVNIHAQRTRYLACLQVEEFIFLLSHVSASKATHVAEKLRMAVEQLRLFVDVRLSFGVSLFVAGDTHATLLNRADMALYKAKKN